MNSNGGLISVGYPHSSPLSESAWSGNYQCNEPSSEPWYLHRVRLGQWQQTHGNGIRTGEVYVSMRDVPALIRFLADELDKFQQAERERDAAVVS